MSSQPTSSSTSAPGRPEHPYNQSQFYVGVSSSGFVAIFRGTNQSLAGISLSSLQSQSPLKAAMLTSDDQATLQQTITANSLADAQRRVSKLETQAASCKQTYETLRTWQANSLAYQKYLTAKRKAAADKAKAPLVVPNPGPMPVPMPSLTVCAGPAAFGIPASALPATGTTASGSYPEYRAQPDVFR